MEESNLWELARSFFGGRPMASRFSRGWQLLKQSWAVMRQDRSLVLFPIMSSIACIVVTISFVVPLVLFMIGSGQANFNQADGQQPREWQNIAYYVWAF